MKVYYRGALPFAVEATQFDLEWSHLLRFGFRQRFGRRLGLLSSVGT